MGYFLNPLYINIFFFKSELKKILVFVKLEKIRLILFLSNSNQWIEKSVFLIKQNLKKKKKKVVDNK